MLPGARDEQVEKCIAGSDDLGGQHSTAVIDTIYNGRPCCGATDELRFA